MTTALCFNCGETKFGALCPCGKCGAAASGNAGLDILFSDHQMTVPTLVAFGTVVKALTHQGADPEVRFWAFISYVSSHPAGLLTASPPAEVAERVAELLAATRLPIVTAELKTPLQSDEPPQRELPFPEPLFRRFVETHRFHGLATVQLRRDDGLVFRGTLMDRDGPPEVYVNADIDVSPDRISAVRPAPGCLLGWLIKPRWVEAD